MVSIAYSSPGGINLEGLGEAIDAIRGLLKDILGGHFQNLKAASIDISIKEESHRHQRHINSLEEIRSQIKLADEIAKLMRKHGYSDDEVKGFVRRGFLEPSADLARLSQQGKLSGLEEPKKLPPSKDSNP